ncbi:MAG TPA: helix-turn-helix domain-containing protein, partial [Candidatus Deferrimicrobium sp.]|nr:helix-turn-helix domain-containing protein [Candidatus Deferrimicrobium sp.]
MSSPGSARFSVGEAARMVGISPSTLRAWEQQGLVPAARSSAGWRRYDAGDVARAREVHRLREVEGLAVHAIARRLRATGSRSARRVATVAAPASGAVLGPRLRERRAERGMSLRALAALAGVSPSLVSGVERGVVQPSIASLQKLSAALGTT